MLSRPLQNPAAEFDELDSTETGSNPAPLSDTVTTKSASWQAIAILARVAPECFRMLVSASSMAKNKWWRDCDDTGCAGTRAGISNSQSMPVLRKYSWAY